MINWIEYLDIDNKYIDENAQRNILKFIFLWLKINEYCNKKYGSDKSDTKKINKLSDENILKEKYATLKDDFLEKFASQEKNGIQRTFVIDMRYPNIESEYKYFTQEHDNLHDFLKIIYQIRCNLFHGEKEPSDENIELVLWAYDCLNELCEGIIWKIY